MDMQKLYTAMLRLRILITLLNDMNNGLDPADVEGLAHILTDVHNMIGSELDGNHEQVDISLDDLIEN